MSPRELPVACSLDVARLRAREAELAALGGSLISVSDPPGPRAVLSFTADEGTKDRLDRIVAAEAECCPFLDLRVSEGETLELSLDGPAEATPLIADLVGAIRGSVAT
jgi:hypothetical protein